MTRAPARLTRFIAASGLTNLADGIATLAWAWVASLLTRDPLWIAAVPVALRLPWFLFALPAGLTADRVDRRRLILSADCIRAVAFALAGVVLWLSLPLPEAPVRGLAQPGLFTMILLAALTVGVAEVYRDNAAQTMLPALVAPAQLERANGRLWSVELIGNALIGPALAAMLIGWSLPLPFLLNAGAMGLAVVLVAGLGGRFRPEPRISPDWRAELGEAFAYLKGEPLLRVLAWLTGFWNLTFQMVAIALILFVQERLGLSALAYGLILAAGAVGGILGGFMAGFIVARTGPARAAQWSMAVSPLGYLAIAFSPGPVTLAVAMAVFHFAGLVWNTVSVSYRQRTVPDALMGRVNSLYRLLAWGMMPLGLILSGLSVRLAEGVVGRSEALLAPFLLAALLAGMLTVLGWRPLGRGFRGSG